MERMVETSMLSVGGSIGFYHGNLLEIKDDIAALKPTIFVSVPRLWNKMCDGIKAKFAETTGCKRMLVDKAVAAKMAKVQETGVFTHCLWDKLVFKKVRAKFGGRVRCLVSGSAPLSKETISFLKIAFCCPLYEGYGLTETLVTATTRP
jgi:long-chain acyl-CoA synthetase